MSSHNPNEYDPSVIDSDDIYTHPERVGSRERTVEPVQDIESYIGNGANRQTRKKDTTQRQETRRPSSSPKTKKPQKEDEDDGPGLFRSIVNFVTDRRTHGAIGIGLILFAAYILIASLSYFVHGSQDQSAISSNSIEQLANSGTTENIGGPTGAVLSQVLLTNSLGLGSGVLIFYLTILGLALLRVKKINFWSVTFKCLLIAITISLVAGLITYPLENSFLYGGQHGRWINTLLIQRAGWIGAFLVSAFLVACVVFIYLNELIMFYLAYRRRVAEHKAKLEAARKARAEDDAKVRAHSTDDILRQDPDIVIVPSTEEQPVVGFGNAGENIHTDDIQDPFIDDEPEIIDTDTTERQPIRPFAGGRTLNDVYANTDTVPQPQQTAQEPAQPTAQTVAPEPVQSVAQPETTTPKAQPVNVNEGLADVPVVESAERPISTAELQIQPDEPVFVENITQEIETADAINRKPFDPTSELPDFKLPPIDILRQYEENNNTAEVDQESNEQKDEIIHALDTYGIKISKVEATVGATITLFEITPVEGTRVQTIKRLGDDLMMTLAAKGIRIIAPIPGKSSIGIEVPNKNPQTVSIRSILSSKDFQESKYELPIAMGTTISNKVYIADLAKMPHLLVAGATGQGKSVGLNTIIASLLYKKHPATLKFVLVDPKMVEFSLYNCLERHYLAKLPEEESPVITESDKVVNTLNSLCVEMDNRYRLLMAAGCRNIVEYNTKFINRDIDEADGHRFMPYIVIIVDEYGDLLMTAGKDIETPIARIGQKARAVGMHMILATQRPSTKIVNGTIKANFPGRIAFKVASGVDSQTILDRPGANQLIGRGDMLIWANGSIERVQCAFIDTPEVEAVCNFISRQPSFLNAYPLPEYVPEGAGGENTGNIGALTDRDPLFDEIARYVSMSNQASTTSLQRRYSIGFARAGKIMDQLEAAGVVGPSSSGKPRSVLMTSSEVEDFLSQNT